MPDEFLNSILAAHQLTYADAAIIQTTSAQVAGVITSWAGQWLGEIKYAGSYAKGTGVRGSSDVDLFISLNHDTPGSISDLHQRLLSYLVANSYSARTQNVSIGLSRNGLSIDLTPGKKHPGNTNDHSIYSHRRRTWQQTNVDDQIRYVRNSGRINEIKLAKIWRTLHGLDFPSFFVECAVIDALSGARGTLSQNFATVLQYLRDSLPNTSLSDPGNTNNTVSDDLTLAEKQVIAQEAGRSYASNWGDILW